MLILTTEQDNSSSQPIPNDILKESSDLIESHYVQPFCRITLNPTKEVAGSNIISEAFYRLDFCNAIRDIRRFAYVSKLLHLLITQNLTSLSGNATKALFWMLEEIAKQVATNKQNIHVIRELLVELREIVDKYLCWGRPLGSTALWEQHLRTMERICEMTDAIQIESPEDKDKPSWNDLPEELIREILLRLSDYKDLERSAEACERMNLLLNEERHIWKQLCKYHFTKDQLRWANQLATNANHAIHTKIYGANSDIVDWEQMFHLLRKKFGLKEEYADCLFLCRYCRCLFWKSKGHPCILENPDLTRQLTTSVSNVSSSSKSEIIASLRKKSSPLFVSATCSPNTNVLGANRTRNHSSPNSQNPSHLSNISPLRPVQHHQIPLGPVAVQNIPFFEHPLVLQQQRRQEQNRDDANNNVRQQQQQRQPFENIRQRFQNAQNGNVPQREQQEANNVSAFPKAPLYIPITPHAFLKFFSL
ncbi:F-box only protein 32 [Blomia tropicalis]|nr:F-box only protein 32 [Blomia tropicalis]